MARYVDPSVLEATRLTRGKVRLGSSFQPIVSFLGRRVPLEYRITEFERPSRLVPSGGDSSLRSIDEITFVSGPGGTRATYEARLALTGIRRLADPILDVLLQRIGRLAVRGLRGRLAGPGTGDASSEVGAGHGPGVVEGEDFSSALFSIWLGERALDDSLRRQLLASG